MNILARIRAWFKPRPPLTLNLPPPAFSLHHDEAASLRRMQRHERDGVGFPPVRKHFERDLPSLFEVTAEARKQIDEKDAAMLEFANRMGEEMTILKRKLEACEQELKIVRQTSAARQSALAEVDHFLREEDGPDGPSYYSRLTKLIARRRRSARARTKRTRRD